MKFLQTGNRIMFDPELRIVGSIQGCQMATKHAFIDTVAIQPAENGDQGSNDPPHEKTPA